MKVFLFALFCIFVFKVSFVDSRKCEVDCATVLCNKPENPCYGTILPKNVSECRCCDQCLFATEGSDAVSECTPESCHTVKCQWESSCPRDSYPETFGYCGCCRRCRPYSKEGETCGNDGPFCAGFMQCESGICHCNKRVCTTVKCARPENCDPQNIIPSNPDKCECCPTCAL